MKYEPMVFRGFMADGWQNQSTLGCLAALIELKVSLFSGASA